jgi:hypothetical protein
MNMTLKNMRTTMSNLSFPDFDDPVDATGRAIDSQPTYNRMINTELMLPQNGEYQPVTVVRQTVGPSGRPEGQYHVDPAMNSMTYNVRFPDGDVKEYAANIIAENLLNQINDEGFSTTMVEAVVDHRKTDAAVAPDDMYTISHNGTKRIRQTTCGWQLLVKWKDGSKQWVPLSVLKDSNPVDVAKYAKARGIHTEPAFAWWVPYTLRKRYVIISSVQTRARKTSHKYGVEIPTDIRHAHALDKKNGNDVWARALKKEMLNGGIAFEILEPEKHAPPGCGPKPAATLSSM